MKKKQLKQCLREAENALKKIASQKVQYCSLFKYIQGKSYNKTSIETASAALSKIKDIKTNSGSVDV